MANGKKVSKKVPDGYFPGVQLGSGLVPNQIAAAVAKCKHPKVPETLLGEIGILLLCGPVRENELALVAATLDAEGESLRAGAVAPPRRELTRKELLQLAEERGNSTTAAARQHRFLGLELVTGGIAKPALRQSLRMAIEEFAGHRRDARRKPPCGGPSYDWRWLLPNHPKTHDAEGRPTFDEPAHRSLWQWLRVGTLSGPVPSSDPNKSETRQRVTRLLEAILGAPGRRGGLLQYLAKCYHPDSQMRFNAVESQVLLRSDGSEAAAFKPFDQVVGRLADAGTGGENESDHIGAMDVKTARARAYRKTRPL